MAVVSDMWVEGLPTGTRAWRSTVASRWDGRRIGDGVTLAFALPPRRWVDLDTLVESTVRGLRDADAVDAARLDVVVATKASGVPAGVVVTDVPTAALRCLADVGPSLLDVESTTPPRAGSRDAKRAWRGALARRWAGREPPDGRVWADVAIGTAGPLLARVEVVIDSLEPVLGRDPRGRDWQEFFPNDHVIEWLRVQRRPVGSGVRLRLGTID